MPRARGTAYPIKRRYSHIHITLTDFDLSKSSLPRRKRERKSNGHAPSQAKSSRRGLGLARGFKAVALFRRGIHGAKVRPTGFRTGIMVDWQSHWYANKQDFAELLVEDEKIRELYQEALQRGRASAKIRIERTREKVVVYIHAARVGMIIGKKGQEVEKLTKELEDLGPPPHRSQDDGSQPARGGSPAGGGGHRRAAGEAGKFPPDHETAMDQTMEAGAKGIRIQLAGRLGGSEMARSESAMAGSIPLSTLRAKIDYGFTEAKTAQGNIGIKVWINNGDYLDPEENNDAANAQAGKVSKKPARER